MNSTSTSFSSDIRDHRSLSYSNVGTYNFPHEVKQVEWYPQGALNQNIGQGDVVRITINSEDFLEPMSTMVEITVDLSSNTYLADDSSIPIRNKIMQLDGGAQSILSSMIVTCGDTEIERITQMDIISNILKDVMYDNTQREMKDYEGNGGIQTMSTPLTMSAMSQIPILNDGTTKSIKGYNPFTDSYSYVDNNNRSIQNPLSSTNFITRNFANSYTGYAPQVTYNTSNICYSNGTDIDEIDNNSSDATRGTYRNNPQAVGMTLPLNPNFGNNGYEPWFSQTVPFKYLKNGWVKSDKPLTATFQFPLLSSFFGSLIPPNNWKLIPLKYLPGLTFEFTFNPHAFFTSWFSTNQGARTYVIKKFSLRTQIVKVNDKALTDQIDAEYKSNGIRISSQAFFYGPNYPFAPGAAPQTCYVNLGFESLRNFLFCFIPNDFTANSNCRKQYRISMALTSMQLQMGTIFYPAQPIAGNGGTNFGTINNNEFVKYLWKCFGKQCGQSPSVINCHNFAVNFRENEPTSSDTYFTGDTQLGFFLENKVIGKAVYGIPLDSMNFEGKSWSGVNTTNNIPFQLNLTYDSGKAFNRAATMHTFLHHDHMLVITPGRIFTVGRR